MQNPDLSNNREPGTRGWAVIFLISLAFLLWGLLVYFTVGDKWPPPWDYGTVPDLPGQSVYSTSREEKIRPQHIRGSDKTTDQEGSGK